MLDWTMELDWNTVVERLKAEDGEAEATELD